MSTKLTSGTRRAAVLLATAAVSLVAAASAAEAHVTVNPNTEPQGGYAKVSFRVPNEEANASTTSLEVDIPVDHPIASVSVRPVPGWTATTTTSRLATPVKTGDGDVAQAVSKIVWTGGKIDPGQFQEFDVSLGPLPKDTDKIVFKALQTYSDGNVVRWIDIQQPGQPEPDHPAPVLHLTPASATGTGTGTNTGANAGTTAPTTAPSLSLAADANTNANAKSASGSSDTAARTLGIAGLGIGVLGFGTAIVALRRKSDQPSSSD
jgi:uncharacterized protein YcnI